MVRNIKFRAWDEENNQMFQWDDTFFYDTSAVTNWSGDFSYIKMPLMQFTGLKDYNNIEIYENDIVEAINRNHDSWVSIRRVTYLNGCYMFGSWNAHEYFNKHTNIRVIGNYYENPELLKEGE